LRTEESSSAEYDGDAGVCRRRGGTPAPTRHTRNASVALKTEATAMLPLERAQMAASTTSWYKIPGMIEDLSPKEQN